MLFMNMYYLLFGNCLFCLFICYGYPAKERKNYKIVGVCNDTVF